MDMAKVKQGSFGWLNATQFLGALNDNVFRWLLIFFLIGIYGQDNAGIATAVVGAVFVAPFLLFTAFAGNLADRFSKRNIIVIAKAAELAVMILGCIAFVLGSPIAVCVVLFMMCSQSAFFGPSKYGIVPELVEPTQLSRANSFLEGLTYSAIVIGTAIAPFLSQITNRRYGMASVICIVLSAGGLLSSLSIHRTPPAGGRNRASFFFVKDVAKTLASIRGDKDLMLTVIASAYFMLLGGFMQMNLIPYGIQTLGFSEVQSGYLFVVAAIGIGTGSFLAGKLSGRNVEFGIVPLGAIGLAFCSIALGLMDGGKYPVFAVVFLLGISAGLFIVPVHAFIQFRSPSSTRGEIVAASGFLGWTGVMLSAGVLYVFCGVLNFSAGQMFLIMGVLTFVLSVITVILLPDFLVRFICVMLARMYYRIKVTGAENVPADKSALLVCNHVSWADALLLAATQQRRIRFIMDKSFYNKPLLKPLCKLMGAIPISATDPPKKIISSLRQARGAMSEGFMVCIFAEGMITRSGMMFEFKAGLERIVKGTGYDIIPVYLGGVWGSIFSYSGGKIVSKPAKKFPYPVSIHFGKPMAPDSSVSQIRQKVTELSCDYFNGLKTPKRSLVGHFVKSARKNWTKRCISDSTGKSLNYGKTLTGAIALAKKIDALAKGSENVGICLPPSSGGALANLAVTISGRVAVNMNYTAGREAIDFATKECGIKCVISSRIFLEKAGISIAQDGLVYLEDIAGRIERKEKFIAYLKARFVPLPLLTMGRRHFGDDLVTVIFSSGSSGKPKGVMLSHHNIISNIEAIRIVIQIRPDDNLCGILPFFHSFGFNCGLWLPLISGVSVGYVANPLDGEAVGKSIRENRSTIIFAPPTFFLNYIRRLKREDFASIRLVAAGAEKLKKRLADKFEEKFGIRPLEGYGATELSPVASLSVPDVETDGVYQVGTKLDSVGHPIPGVAIKIVDIETQEEIAVGREGLIMVKGPSVMVGYLNNEEQTAEVLKDGWYNTGDIGKVDAEGFLTITDRLSRFSKIGGEMVPHIAIEQAYLEGLGTHEQVVAVTSVPDSKKGEVLVVLYSDQAGTADKLHEIITSSALPNICKPKRDNYIRVESMPTLGSGKLDVMKLRKIALEAKNKPDGC